MAKYIRYGVGDVVFSEEEMELLGDEWWNPVKILDKDGNEMKELEFYWVANEDEEGNEVE
tara:strand:- start:403 stop:582 length:180 start_codon:yes stop_codon:yes gene_type:complete